jgi:ketosteroid isomerase-like protein
MHPNAELLTRFYAAFARRDAEAMAACYAPDVVFSDPVFPKLEGVQAGNMWRMLCAAGKDLRVEASGIEADDTTGRAHWDAWYTFSATGRSVHNIIDARFEFANGLIRRHTDTFDLWRWSRLALGPSGLFLGWSPLVQNTIRDRARRGLEKWTADAAKRA